MKEIANKYDYDQAISKIDTLMAKESDKVSKEELTEIRSLAQMAQDYERIKYVIDMASL